MPTTELIEMAAAPQQLANQQWASVEEELAWHRDWVRRAADVCRRAADGDLEPRLLHAPTDGDMGVMLHGINHLLDMTDAFVRESGAALDHAAEGKYFRRVLLRGLRGSFRHGAGVINRATEQMAAQAQQLKDSEARRRELASEMEVVISTLASSASEMRATAETLADTAQRTTNDLAGAASAAGQTSVNVANVASTSRELRSTFSKVDQQTQQCAAAAQEAARHAEDARPVMENLQSVSERVAGVVKLIGQIARQTNLLALNATIEAARSGEAGRGFAVVAAEVKELARNTADATEEIGTEIQRMRAATEQVTATNATICQKIESIDTIAAGIAEVVAQQSESTDEISRNASQAAAGTEDVSRSMQSVTDVARQMTECATQLLAAADDLARQAESLRASMAHLLGGIAG